MPRLESLVLNMLGYVPRSEILVQRNELCACRYDRNKRPPFSLLDIDILSEYTVEIW
jgi:hypothetical protein